MNQVGSDDLRRLCRSKEQAHEAARAAYALAQVMLMNGDTPLITCSIAAEPIEIRQRNFFHGVVLKQISEQVVLPDGGRYTIEVWKEYFRKLFLPDRWVMKSVPRWDSKLCRLVQPKKATPHRERQSTENLGTRKYSELIDQVIAHAVVEFGVQFEFTTEERDGARWQPARQRRAPAHQEEQPA